jgi:hypothetical protein
MYFAFGLLKIRNKFLHRGIEYVVRDIKYIYAIVEQLYVLVIMLWDCGYIYIYLCVCVYIINLSYSEPNVVEMVVILVYIFC